MPKLLKIIIGIVQVPIGVSAVSWLSLFIVDLYVEGSFQINLTLGFITFFVLFLLVSTIINLREVLSNTDGWVFKSISTILFYPTSFVFVFASAYYYLGIMEGDSCVINNSSSSIYFSIVTWTTLGYGDFHPIGNTSMRLLSSLEAFIGYLFSGILVGMVFHFAQTWGNNRMRDSSSN